LQALLCDFEKQAFTRANEINSEKKPLEEKLIGLKFNMKDRKAIAMEAHNTIVIVEQEVKLILQRICKHEEKVRFVIICLIMFFGRIMFDILEL
jgi:beta-galactosidase beta subunit